MCAFSYTQTSRFSSCDSEFDPTTLTYKFDLDILLMYLHTKNEVSRSRLSKVTAQTGQTYTCAYRQTDATERITTVAFSGCNKILYFVFCIWTKSLTKRILFVPRNHCSGCDTVVRANLWILWHWSSRSARQRYTDTSHVQTSQTCDQNTMT